MDHLLTEARNPTSHDLDRLTPLELARLLNAADAEVIPAVAGQAEAIARVMEVIADRLRRGGRLVYQGAGTSGRLGVLDAAECPPTFSSPVGQVVGLIAGGSRALTTAVEGAEDDPSQGSRDLEAIGLSANDVLVGIATSGRTPYVLGGLAHARAVGAFTVGLACNPDSELEPLCDVAIVPAVGPEVLTGSTRMKAGTATKLVLNALSTGAMVLLGKTYGNLMVDLRATNVKLRARTNRIVRQLTGLTEEEAAALLSRCDGELKTALVAQRGGLTPEEARARLVSTGGQVRLALAAGSSTLLLGLDGGGSHTTALLAERIEEQPGWRVVGHGTAGPSNVRTLGAATATAALDRAVTAAFEAAGRPRVSVKAACLGLAGAGRSEEQDAVRAWAERVQLAEQVLVTTDAALLLAAGTPDGWGVAVVAGTGSIAWGRSADGRTARAGGWGPTLGDEGSGYALVLAALRAVTRAADGRGPQTALTAVLLDALGVSRPAELVTALHGGNWDRAALAALAPKVLATAAAGDAVATPLVQQEAQALAQTAAAVCRELDLTAAPPLALAGGALLGSEAYRLLFLHQLNRAGLTPGPITSVLEPAEGALRLSLL